MSTSGCWFWVCYCFDGNEQYSAIIFKTNHIEIKKLSKSKGMVKTCMVKINRNKIEKMWNDSVKIKQCKSLEISDLLIIWNKRMLHEHKHNIQSIIK